MQLSSCLRVVMCGSVERALWCYAEIADTGTAVACTHTTALKYKRLLLTGEPARPRPRQTSGYGRVGDEQTASAERRLAAAAGVR